LRIQDSGFGNREFRCGIWDAAFRGHGVGCEACVRSKGLGLRIFGIWIFDK